MTETIQCYYEELYNNKSVEDTIPLSKEIEKYQSEYENNLSNITKEIKCLKKSLYGRTFSSRK